MDINRFLTLAKEFDELTEEYDASRYELYASGGDEMHNLSPRGKHYCNRLRKRIRALKGRMDTIESTIVDFIQDTKFDRDFQLQRRLGNIERVQQVTEYFQIGRPSQWIQKISKFI